jgi:hypothetical protein
MSIWELDMARILVKMIPVAGRSFRYLWLLRAAVPLPVKVLLVLAMIIKFCPVDFGTDEALTAVAVLLLGRMRPGLVKACWRAAQLEGRL